MATSLRNPSQLLHIDVQLAGSFALVAANDGPGRTVQPVEPMQLMPSQHRIARGPRMTEEGAQPVRTELAGTAKRHDSHLRPGIEASGAVVRSEEHTSELQS